MAIDTIFVNLWAAPCMGKSGTMGLVYGGLKALHVSCEPVPEYAKDLHWDGTLHQTSQFDIANEQFRREDRLRGIVQVAVSDSPVLMGILHQKHRPEELTEHVLKKIAGRREMNYVIYRDLLQSYEQAGRRETPEQAMAHHERVVALVKSYDPDVKVVPTEYASGIIIADVLSALNRTSSAPNVSYIVRARHAQSGQNVTLTSPAKDECSRLFGQLSEQGFEVEIVTSPEPLAA